MKSIKLDKSINDIIAEIPSGWCFFTLKKGKEHLYCGYSGNLPHRLKMIWEKADEDKLYAELRSEASTLHFMDHETAISALIQYKIALQKTHPAFQQRIHTWGSYVYLGIDALRFPFVTIESHTNDDWFYLGPFRSRFFLADVMESISRILKIPYCETDTYPCDKLDKDICRGYCLSLDSEQSGIPQASLEKLVPLLKEAYVHPQNAIIDMIQKHRDAFFDNLEFEKADLLDDELDLLKRYRDWLNFLYIGKELAFDEPDLKVVNGQIIWCCIEDCEYHFPQSITLYRPNEALALNLDLVDEARIIYEYYTKHKEVN
ncbi:MAG: hypothetical protein Q8J62_08215 [Candidatus Cloacimonadaceae bacterium]|nr:hypothetical protein [Candidatus Cloacimonadaceae bacterium]